MAQDTKPAGTTEEAQADDLHAPSGERRDSRFHYYSGGEVRELENTKVSPVLWGFWLLLIGCAVVGVFAFGALGPDISAKLNLSPYKPVAGSQSAESKASQDMQARSDNSGVQLVSVLDLSRLPLPAGQNLDKAIDAGSDIYQAQCIGCHGPNQDGNGVTAAGLNPKPRNLRDAPFMQSMSYQRITTSVHKGVPGTAMPRWENILGEDDIKDVIAYVLSLSKPVEEKTAPAKPAAAVTGTPTGADISASSNANPPAGAAQPTAVNTTAVPAAPAVSATTGMAASHVKTAPKSGVAAHAATSSPSAKTVNVTPPSTALAPATGPAPGKPAIPSTTKP